MLREVTQDVPAEEARVLSDQIGNPVASARA
jgi:hypothetical protein